MGLASQRRGGYPTTVSVAVAGLMGDYRKPAYATAVNALCRIKGAKQIVTTGDEANQQTGEQKRIYFRPGQTRGYILTAKATSVNLTLGSLITHDGKKYKVTSVDVEADDNTDRVIEIIVTAVFSGVA